MNLEDLVVHMIEDSVEGLTVIQMEKICHASRKQIGRVSHKLMCQCKIRNPDQYGRYRPLIKEE